MVNVTSFVSPGASSLLENLSVPLTERVEEDFPVTDVQLDNFLPFARAPGILLQKTFTVSVPSGLHGLCCRLWACHIQKVV